VVSVECREVCLSYRSKNGSKYLVCVSLYFRKLAAYHQTVLCASEELQLQIQSLFWFFFFSSSLHLDVKYFSHSFSLFIMSVYDGKYIVLRT